MVEFTGTHAGEREKQGNVRSLLAKQRRPREAWEVIGGWSARDKGGCAYR